MIEDNMFGCQGSLLWWTSSMLRHNEGGGEVVGEVQGSFSGRLAEVHVPK